MFLRVENPSGLNLDDFINYLIKQIIVFVDNCELVNKRDEQRWNNFFEQNDIGWKKDMVGNPVSPKVSYIVDEYFKNLIVIREGQDYIITTDPMVKLNGTQLTIDMLATMINDGTLTVAPYTYFDNVFDVFAKTLQLLYDDWITFGGR